MSDWDEWLPMNVEYDQFEDLLEKAQEVCDVWYNELAYEYKPPELEKKIEELVNAIIPLIGKRVARTRWSR